MLEVSAAEVSGMSKCLKNQVQKYHIFLNFFPIRKKYDSACVRLAISEVIVWIAARKVELVILSVSDVEVTTEMLKVEG